MIQVLLIIVCAASLAVAFEKKIEDFLAPVLMATMLFVYCGGILRCSLRLFSYMAMGLMLAIAVVCVIVSYKRQSAVNSRIPGWRSFVLTPSFIICVITCVVFGALFSTHRLMHWDDLSYWGIYLKDIFCLDRLPLGVENCTISYKDYPPIQQIMEYFFMFTGGSFNEPVAFGVNVCFLYVLMLPFLSGFTKTKSISGKIVTVIMYVIFPHIFTTQFYYKLGLDFLISVMFGYGIYLIIKDEGAAPRSDDKMNNEMAPRSDDKMNNEMAPHSNGKNSCGRKKWLLGDFEEIYRLICLIIISSYLALIKTSGVVLTLFLVLFYSVRASKMRVICKKILIFIEGMILSGFIPMCAYLTWKLWGRRTGNHGYLSDIVSSNVKSFEINFPPYTGEVTLNYIKHIFTYPLTRENFGVTAFVMMLIIAIMYHVRRRNLLSQIEVCDNDSGVLLRNFTVHKSLHIIMCIGIFVFCVAHLYMYLFVFDDWEAFGLLEFDRYINQYLAGVLFVYLYDLWGDFERLRGIAFRDGAYSFAAKGARVLKYVNPAFVIVAFLVALLPYPSIGEYLVPGNYNELYSDTYVATRIEAAAEWDACALKTMNLPLDEDHRVMLIGNAWTDQFQFLTLEMVPQAVTVATNAPALGEGEICDFITDQIVARGIEYIYVMNNADADYPGDIAAESIEKFGVALECGQSYYVDRTNDTMEFQKL